jgi:hypothetical protein
VFEPILTPTNLTRIMKRREDGGHVAAVDGVGGVVAISGLGLPGSGTAQGTPPRHEFRFEVRPVTRKGPVGMDVAAARRLDRAEASARGAQVDPAPGDVAVHAPLPPPEMAICALELLADWLADEPQMADDPGPALARSFMAPGESNTSSPSDTQGNEAILCAVQVPCRQE